MSTKIWLCALGVALIVVSGRLGVVAAQRDKEKASHAVTQEQLEKSIANEKAWIAAYQAVLENAVAQQESAQVCLDREAKARTDATERAAILGQAKPRPRPQQEQVVDDETRNRIAGRLNRPL